MNREQVTRAIIKVGDGRGFIVQGRRGRLVVTAGHCLPAFPPCCSFSETSERTYARLLGPIGEEPSVWAECLFADPISDLAVLGAPDGQELSTEAESFEALVDSADPIAVSEGTFRDTAPQNEEEARLRAELGIRPLQECQAWLLSLDCRWFPCVAWHKGGALWLSQSAEPMKGGMSGSPILADDGTAVGVFCTSSGRTLDDHEEGGPNPRLAYNLPAGLLSEILEASG
jgi:hypothetical protein